MIQSFLLNRTNRTPYTRLDHTTTGSFTLLGSAAIVLLFILTHASLVQGATYYVATTGSDSNIGTLTSPFRTIKKASLFFLKETPSAFVVEITTRK